MLDAAQRLRGLYFIDPEDGEFKETIKKRKEQLDVPMEAALPCKKEQRSTSGLQEAEAKSCEPNKIPKTKHACIVEAHESTRQRLESSPPKGHEDHRVGHSKEQKGLILEAQRDKKKVHFATLMDICDLKKCGVRAAISEV